MAQKIRKLTKRLSVEEYRQSYFDVVKTRLDYMLREVPGAQYIDFTVIEYYDDGQPEGNTH